jgi:hypothetical protein
MICPKCKSEYRQGFNECADCKVALVHSLDEIHGQNEPDEDIEDFAAFAEFMRITDISYAAFIRSVLIAEGIDHYVLGEHANFHGMLPVEQIIRVKKDQFERAREILDEIEGSGGPI